MPHTTQGAIVVNGVVAPEMAAAHVPSWAASLKLHSSVINMLRCLLQRMSLEPGKNG